MYPKNFYGNENFGLWSENDPRVKADCELVLALLRAYRQPDFGGRRKGHKAFHEVFAWAADRCTYDLAGIWMNHDGAKGNPKYHWHTQGARENWEANARQRSPKNNFDHAVPQKLIIEELTALYVANNSLDWESIRDYLKPRRAMAVLTKEEHAKLNKFHKHTMPTGADTANPFARYEAIRRHHADFTLLPPLNRLNRQNPG